MKASFEFLTGDVAVVSVKHNDG